MTPLLLLGHIAGRPRGRRLHSICSFCNVCVVSSLCNHCHVTASRAGTLQLKGSSVFCQMFFTQQHEILKLLTLNKLWKQCELLFISVFGLGIVMYYFSLKAAVLVFTCISGSLALHHPAGVGFSPPFPRLVF